MKTMVLKTNIGTPWNTQGTTWTTPSLSQYNSRRFVNQVLTAIAGRAAEEIVSGMENVQLELNKILLR
jgi:ATP-dependent Zn protease